MGRRKDPVSGSWGDAIAPGSASPADHEQSKCVYMGPGGPRAVLSPTVATLNPHHAHSEPPVCHCGGDWAWLS